MDKGFTEKYRFGTKEYWKNYWFYYKVHTIAAVIAIFFFTSGIYSCATNVKPDLTVLYLGKFGIQSQDDAQAVLNTLVRDVNNDGKVKTNVINMPLGDEQDVQLTSAYVSKADVELMPGEPRIFITLEEYVKKYRELECYTYLDDIADKYNIPQEKRLKETSSGKTVAIDISGTKFIDMLKTYDTGPIYIFVKTMNNRKMNDEKAVRMHDETMRILEIALSDN